MCSYCNPKKDECTQEIMVLCHMKDVIVELSVKLVVGLSYQIQSRASLNSEQVAERVISFFAGHILKGLNIH